MSILDAVMSVFKPQPKSEFVQGAEEIHDLCQRLVQKAKNRDLGADFSEETFRELADAIRPIANQFNTYACLQRHTLERTKEILGDWFSADAMEEISERDLGRWKGLIDQGDTSVLHNSLPRCRTPLSNDPLYQGRTIEVRTGKTLADFEKFLKDPIEHVFWSTGMSARRSIEKAAEGRTPDVLSELVNRVLINIHYQIKSDQYAAFAPSPAQVNTQEKTPSAQQNPSIHNLTALEKAEAALRIQAEQRNGGR